jgi:hypothetical protein
MEMNTMMERDLAVLTALNRDYVTAHQKGDVKRFEEILADDFMYSNPDASLVDKAGFLQQIARPVTISELVAEDVQIRLLGDVAIIYARISYWMADDKYVLEEAQDDDRHLVSFVGELKHTRQHQGRYTDVWVRRDDKWLAVSGHTTAEGWSA